MKKLVLDAIRQMAIEWAKTPESKEQAKKVIIDFLQSDEEYGYFLLDELVRSILSKEDWQEIAKEVGEDIIVIGDMVFTRDGIAMSKEYNVYKA